MTLFEFDKGTNTIYSNNHMFDVAIVTFTHASTKGSGKRRSCTKIIVGVESANKEEHFKKWAKTYGYCNAKLIEWLSCGIAWLSPKTLENPKKISKNIIKGCPYLMKGKDQYDLTQYQPNQWMLDISAQVMTEVVAYSYETVRGQKKTYEKNITFFKDQNPQEVFLCWVKIFNEDYRYKELRNVQILCNSLYESAI